MKLFLHVLFVLFTTSIVAQNINDYAYVIVPEKFESMERVDKYQVNSLTKFLLNKYGFEAYLLRDKKPFNLEDSTCDVLYAELKDDSNFIQTRVAILLKDCKGEIVYKTRQGRSKEKDFKGSYHKAIRAAALEFESLKYSYNGIKKVTPSTPKEISIQKPVDEISEVGEQEDKATAITSPPVSSEKDKESVRAGEKKIDIPSENEALRVIAKSPLKNREEISSSTVFMSADKFYKAVQIGTMISFYQGDINIGNSSILREDGFLVSTSQFEGEAFFKDDQLVIERKIPGVAGIVEMLFTKQ